MPRPPRDHRCLRFSGTLFALSLLSLLVPGELFGAENPPASFHIQIQADPFFGTDRTHFVVEGRGGVEVDTPAPPRTCQTRSAVNQLLVFNTATGVFVHDGSGPAPTYFLTARGFRIRVFTSRDFGDGWSTALTSGVYGITWRVTEEFRCGTEEAWSTLATGFGTGLFLVLDEATLLRFLVDPTVLPIAPPACVEAEKRFDGHR